MSVWSITECQDPDCSRPNVSGREWCYLHMPLQSIGADTIQRVQVATMREILKELVALREELAERHIQETIETIKARAVQ